jgi:hypothetical protein
VDGKDALRREKERGRKLNKQCQHPEKLSCIPYYYGAMLKMYSDL